MNDSTDTLSSSSVATGISDRQIDRLLREAEALTNAIEADARSLSSESDEDPEVDGPACETASQESEDSHTATGEADGFKDLLHDPDVRTSDAESAVTTTQIESEQSADRDEAAVEAVLEDVALSSEDPQADEVISPDADVEDKADETKTTEPDVIGGDSASAESIDHPTAEHRQDADADRQQIPSGSEPGDSQSGQAADTDSEQAASEEVIDESHAPVLSFKKKVMGIIGRVARLCASVPAIMVNTMLSVFILFDRPFNRIPIGTKRVLGYVAIATLLSGIAARFLPDMLNHNPFAEMGTGIQ